MLLSILVKSVPRFSRGIKTSATLQVNSLAQLKKLQSQFQVKDGRPIFLKGGFFDRILYTTTLGLAGVGLFYNIAFIYDKAKPQSWRVPC